MRAMPCFDIKRRRTRLGSVTTLLLVLQATAAQPTLSFVDSGQNLGGNGSGMDVAIDDLDRDGDLDVVVAVSGAASRVWINRGGAQGGTAGTFVDSGQSLATGFSRSVALADLDGDGDLDVFFLDWP